MDKMNYRLVIDARAEDAPRSCRYIFGGTPELRTLDEVRKYLTDRCGETGVEVILLDSSKTVVDLDQIPSRQPTTWALCRRLKGSLSSPFGEAGAESDRPSVVITQQDTHAPARGPVEEHLDREIERSILGERLVGVDPAQPSEERGVLVFNYPEGNSAARAQQEYNAGRFQGSKAYACPRDPKGNWPAVEQVPPRELGKILHPQMERLVLGRTLAATEAEAPVDLTQYGACRASVANVLRQLAAAKRREAAEFDALAEMSHKLPVGGPEEQALWNLINRNTRSSS